MAGDFLGSESLFRLANADDGSLPLLELPPPRKRKFPKRLSGIKSFIQITEYYLDYVSFFSGVILMNAFARNGMQ